jgi:hypothetical protein
MVKNKSDLAQIRLILQPSLSLLRCSREALTQRSGIHMPGLELLYLRINGDGMLPTLLPGEIVFDEHSKSVAPR